ncbi:MAG: response regulator transcription factor, partial [Desulfobulbia bacterium]
YLVKPFELEELWARINALHQRLGEPAEKIIRVGDLELHLDTHKVSRAGKSIELNKACFNLLQILMSASPRIVPRAELELKLWEDMPPGSDVLRSNVYTLRNKIDKPFSKAMLHTVHGVGYKIVDQNSEET